MFEKLSRGKHIALLDNPLNGRALPALALVEEFVRLGHRVTYVTTAEVAARLALLEATNDSWSAVGVLDDSLEPVATVRGYFREDRPDLVVYRTNTCVTAARLLAGWDLPAVHLAASDGAGEGSGDAGPLDRQVVEFVARHGLLFVPHRESGPVHRGVSYD